jgi:hypothetical protein
MEPPSTIVDLLLMKHLTLIQRPSTVIVSLDAEHYVIVKHRPMMISLWYYSAVVFVALWKSVQLSKRLKKMLLEQRHLFSSDRAFAKLL